jgi:hypothetical protein
MSEIILPDGLESMLECGIRFRLFPAGDDDDLLVWNGESALGQTTFVAPSPGMLGFDYFPGDVSLRSVTSYESSVVLFDFYDQRFGIHSGPSRIRFEGEPLRVPFEDYLARLAEVQDVNAVGYDVQRLTMFAMSHMVDGAWPGPEPADPVVQEFVTRVREGFDMGSMTLDANTLDYVANVYDGFVRACRNASKGGK